MKEKEYTIKYQITLDSDVVSTDPEVIIHKGEKVELKKQLLENMRKALSKKWYALGNALIRVDDISVISFHFIEPEGPILDEVEKRTPFWKRFRGL